MLLTLISVQHEITAYATPQSVNTVHSYPGVEIAKCSLIWGTCLPCSVL